MAYAYNEPVVFLETNVRTVFIHHFFADSRDVSDKDLISLVQASLPQDSSLTRDWYWALMDYGTYVKAEIGNLNKLSKAYVKQSAFHGSRRQVRGQVLRALAEKSATYAELQEIIADERLDGVLEDLVREGMLRCSKQVYSL
jgi:A/G-specific adenine glycosylase